MARVNVDGVWGPQTEAAFCEVIGSWATGAPPVTRNAETALRSLKVGAVRDLQTYLNTLHHNWKWLHFGGVTGPHLLGTLVVDGVFGWRTFQALINYVAYCGGFHWSIYIHEVAWFAAGVYVNGDSRKIEVKALQKFINAAHARTKLRLADNVAGNAIPYLRAR